MSIVHPEILIREYKDAFFAANLRDVDFAVVHEGRGWYRFADKRVRARFIEDARDLLLQRARNRAARDLADDALDQQERGER